MTTETDPTAAAIGTAEPNEVAEQLMHCVTRLKRLVDARLGKHGLTMSRIKVLGLLGHNGPCHQSDVATVFELAPRTVTELVDGLERDGLVLRTLDPSDRRARNVDLTAAGRDVLAIAQATRDQIVAEVFGALDPVRLGLLADALRRVNERVVEVSGPDNQPHFGRLSKH
jgi:DNA-binding MarR family transcriptional regulator